MVYLSLNLFVSLESNQIEILTAKLFKQDFRYN